MRFSSDYHYLEIEMLQPDASTHQASNQIMMPLELFQIVFEQLHQGELFKICALSSTFHQWILPALYRHVQLVDSSHDQFKSWTSQIINRPDLAQLVRALSLPTTISYSRTGDISQEWMAHFTGQLPVALKSIDNLTSLFVVRRKIGQAYGTYYLHSDLFLGCAFRLKTFRNDMGPHWKHNSLLSFLFTQDEILEVETGRSPNFIPVAGASLANLLPRLTIASTHYGDPTHFLFKTLASRQLTRLKLVISRAYSEDDVVDAIHALEPASMTLTHFYLRADSWMGPASEAHHVATLRTIANGLPNLKFFHYSIPLSLDVSL